MLLQSNDTLNEIGDLDPNTGILRRLPKSQRPNEALVGAYSILDGRLVALYCSGRRLVLQIDQWQHEITRNTRATVSSSGPMNSFLLKEGDKEVFTVQYRRPILEPSFSEDPTPFIELEDTDFYLFITNVLATEGRRDRVFAEPQRT